MGASAPTQHTKGGGYDKYDSFTRNGNTICGCEPFLEKGYNRTSVKSIAEAAETDIAVVNSYGSKEMLLHSFVRRILHYQTGTIRAELKSETDDKVILCSVWLALLQYIAETDEIMRERFIAEFTIPTLAREIYSLLQEKNNTAFAEFLPLTERADIYELEIAAVGVIRSYFTVACSMYFTISHKINHVADAIFRIYHVPEEKTQ